MPNATSTPRASSDFTREPAPVTLSGAAAVGEGWAGGVGGCGACDWAATVAGVAWIRWAMVSGVGLVMTAGLRLGRSWSSRVSGSGAQDTKMALVQMHGAGA